MAEQDPIQNPAEKPNDIGRPPVLNDEKRRQVISLLANGSSRRVAAQIVGCATSTIERTAERDPAFAERLRAAEKHVEIEALQCIRDAAKNGRHWRAAAWMLERHNPRDFAPKTPTTLSEQDVAHLALQFAQPVLDKMTAEELDEFAETMYNMARACYESDELAKYLPIQPPREPSYLTHDITAAPPSDSATSPANDFNDEFNLAGDEAAEAESFATATLQKRGVSGRQSSPQPDSL